MSCWPSQQTSRAQIKLMRRGRRETRMIYIALLRATIIYSIGAYCCNTAPLNLIYPPILTACASTCLDQQRVSHMPLEARPVQNWNYLTLHLKPQMSRNSVIRMVARGGSKWRASGTSRISGVLYYGFRAQQSGEAAA